MGEQFPAPMGEHRETMNRPSGHYTVRAAVCLGLAALVVAPALTAEAQSWLPDRQYTEGPGLRAGNLEIHPGVAARFGWDSNVFKSDGDNNRRVPSGVAVATPYVAIATLGKQRRTDSGEPDNPGKVAFRAGVDGSIMYYTNDAATARATFLDLGGEFALEILPQQPFSLELGADYVRSTRPFTENVGDVDGNSYLRHMLRPNARVSFGTRGRVLGGYVGIRPNIELFGSDAFDFLDNQTYSPEAGASWKFFPHTALLWDLGVDLRNYSNVNAIAGSAGTTARRSDLNRVATRMGINGAITNRFAARVLLGYATVLVDDAVLSDIQTFVGEANFVFHFGPQYEISFGYNRDVVPAHTGAWRQHDRGMLGAKALFGGAFQLAANVSVEHAKFGDMLAQDLTSLGNNSVTERKDLLTRAALRLEYRATDWLAIMADLTAEIDSTDFEFKNEADAASPDPANYTDLEVFGGIRGHY